MATMLNPNAIPDGSITQEKIDSSVLAAKQDTLTAGENITIVGNVISSSVSEVVDRIVNAGYVFAGVATPATDPGTPEAKVFYIANGKGTYANFGGLEVTEDEVIVLKYDTAWHKEATGIASKEKLTELESEIYLDIEGKTTTDNLIPTQYNNGQYGYEDLNQVLPIGAKLTSVTLYSSGTANTRNSILKIYDANRTLVKDIVLGVIGTSNTEFTLEEEVIVQEGYHYCIAYMGMEYIRGYKGTRFPQGNNGEPFYDDYWMGWTFKYITQLAISSRIYNLEEKVQGIEEQIWVSAKPTIEWVDGFLVNSDNKIRAWGGADRVTKPIRLIKGQSVTITTNGDGNFYFKPIAKVPSDFQIVVGATITEALASKTTGDTIETFTYTATEECYIILCGYNDANLVVSIDNVIVSRFDLLQEQIDAYNPLYGKKLSVDGDSICYGAGYVGGYAKIIGEQNNMIVQNLGVAGGTLASGTGKHIISSSMMNLNDDADYIIIEGGVNDSGNSVALGVITSGFNDTLDTTTFYGAIETICKQLTKKFKGKKYGFLIPHGMSKPMGANWGSSEYGSFNDAVHIACAKWGVPLLDLSKEIPPFEFLRKSNDADFIALADEYTADTLSTGHGDGWHPNEAGYRKYYVPRIEVWLKTS